MYIPLSLPYMHDSIIKKFFKLFLNFIYRVIFPVRRLSRAGARVRRAKRKPIFKEHLQSVPCYMLGIIAWVEVLSSVIVKFFNLFFNLWIMFWLLQKLESLAFCFDLSQKIAIRIELKRRRGIFSSSETIINSYTYKPKV